MVKHFIPKTLEETLKYINEHKTIIISGGTDLMVQRRNWAETPPVFKKNVVYIFNLDELRHIVCKNDNLIIGANTRMSDILIHLDVPELLKEAIYIIASPALRNMATLAGNIGNASPAGDTLPILYALDAKVKLISLYGERILNIEDVITGPRRTVIEDNELIQEIIIPFKEYTNSTFVKVGGRKADAISKVSFTGAIRIEEDLVKELAICFGAVGPTIIRKKSIEAKYQYITTEELKANIENIINDYSEVIIPIDDQRSNKEYRKKVALNLLRDFITNL